MNRAIGIAANPASGKDIRRLVARASVFDNQEKCSIVARCLVGITAVGHTRIVYFDDTHRITRSALEDANISATPIESLGTGTARDTTRAAVDMKDFDCGAVITLGGDGTNRAFVKGWLNAPLIPISTGTNNVFPVIHEATIVGVAAALVASEMVCFEDVAGQQKVIHVRIDDEDDDIALIDAVVSMDRFIGARALLDSSQLRTAFLTRANPAAVGMTAIGGLLEPLDTTVDAGLVIELSSNLRYAHSRVRAPIAPGLFQDVGICSLQRVELGHSVEIVGPCVLALDGERERVLKPCQRAILAIERDGPWVIDVERALQAAAKNGALVLARELNEARNAG